MRRTLFREIRELTRHPPIQHEDAKMLVEAVAAGVRVSVLHKLPGYPERRVVKHWRSTYAYFDQAMIGAEAVQEFRNIERIIEMVQAGTPARPTAIRRKVGCTPSEAKRWLAAAADCIKGL